MRRWIIPIVALFVGLGIGGAVAEGDATGTATVTTTKTTDKSAPPETVVKEVEVEVEVTPKACLDALDSAESGFAHASTFASLAGNGFDVAAQALTAASTLDTATLEALIPELERVSEAMTANNDGLEEVASEYRTSAEACRAL